MECGAKAENEKENKEQPSPFFFFCSHLFELPHELNAWNRLNSFSCSIPNTLQNINRLILKTIIICHICKCLTNFLVIHFFAKIAKETGWQIFETVFNPGHGQKGFRMSRSFQ